MQHLISDITPDACRSALSSFWNDACSIESTKNGLVLTLPILLADGWQVTVYVERQSDGYIKLCDKGQMNSWLFSHGVDIEKDWFKESAAPLIRQFGIHEDECGFSRMLRLPADACEIQLFGAFLSTMSHHVMGIRKTGIPACKVAFTNTLNVARKTKLPFTQNKVIQTPYRAITIDITCDGQSRSAALQTFDQSTRVSESFEIWSSRMQEVSQAFDGKYSTCMVYDEDSCRIQSSMIKVAESRGNLVVPCHKEDEIFDFMRSSVV